MVIAYETKNVEHANKNRIRFIGARGKAVTSERGSGEEQAVKGTGGGEGAAMSKIKYFLA